MTSKARTPAVIPRWIDALILLIILAVMGAAILSAWQEGAFGVAPSADSRLSWHLVRASGLTAYGLLMLSSSWGIFLATRVIKDWSPGPVSLLLHASVSWLAIVLTVVHAGLLMFDSYYTYTLADLTVPFIGPYRPFAVGLGVSAAWLALLINLSFSIRKRIGPRAWHLLHYTSYGAFALATVHALMAGSDADKLGMGVILSVFTVVVAGLLIWRVKHAIDEMRARTRSTELTVRRASRSS